MNALNFLELSTNRRIAYHKLQPQSDGARLPGIIFLGGFKSDMTGIKARYLHDWAERRGRAFVRFDYRGHGQSSEDFEDGCIGDWASDAKAVLDKLTAGPQILVGSSMGGWIALLLARQHPERLAGLIGIAAAPDFTEDSMWARFSADQRAQITTLGRIALPSEYSDQPYVITKRLIEDGRQNLVLRTRLFVPCPVRLLQGTDDVDVEQDVALRLLAHIDCPDLRLTLVKGADHRFSEPGELALLGKTLHGLSQLPRA